MKNRIIFFMGLILFIVMFIPSSVSAKSLNDMYNELAALEAKYNKANSNKKLTQSEIDTLSKEINSINASIASAQADITKAQKEIEESYKKIDEKKNETNELLKFLQLSSGGNTYLEYLFAAEDYTDFMYRYAVVSQMSGYNNKLMDELNALIKDLEEKKKNLAEKEKELEGQRNSVNEKRDLLRTNLAELTEEGTSIEEDIAYLKKNIKYYEGYKCSKTEDADACVNRVKAAEAARKSQSGSRSGVSQPRATGWSYPLKSGCVSSEFTTYRTDWGVGSAHYGIDLACNSEGTSVYAAAAGVVDRIVYKSSCGGNMVFIYHTVNGVNYTSVYMHLLSINVSDKQVVDENTVIGRVGGGSTASYDRCTAGAHLHFGLASGHVSVGFNAYAFNPRNVFTFPQIYAGYFSR